MTIIIPKYVFDCLNKLTQSGFEAWCVGGAVRDLIMGKSPYDFDITTNAQPEDIISLFPKTVPTGIAHGTVTVVTDCGNIEVTTYRSESEYSDHRAPDSITYIKSLDEDLKRRDFTVNAICYNPKSGLYDPLNGCSDIKNHVLRAIGEPEKRFNEDALRIMRLFRFSAQLGFKIESKTLSASLNQSALLQNISVERIFSELKKTLTAAEPQRISPLIKVGALRFLGLPAIEIPDETVTMPAVFALRFASLCRFCSVCETDILKRMKSDNGTVVQSQIYRRLLDAPIPENKPDIKRLLKLSSPEAVANVLSFYGHNGGNTEHLRAMLSEILELNEPYNIKMLKINGDDLKNIGITGAEIGQCLENLTNHVIEHPLDNSLETLKELVSAIKQ